MIAKRYKGYTLEEAEAGLELWKSAKRAAAGGKSYTIEGRSLTRHDLSEINAEIERFAAIVDVFSSRHSGPVRVQARQPRW